MRRPPKPRAGQVGDYWLSKKTRKGRWYRSWYDAASRQTCRVGLGTTSFQEASLRLAAWVVENTRTHLAAPDEVLIESTLLKTAKNAVVKVLKRLVGPAGFEPTTTP